MTRMAGYPLDSGFNVAVLHMVDRLMPCGFDVTDSQDEAPGTLEQLNTHINLTGRILVWAGASEGTIYDDPEVNWSARAWHDWCHWHLQAPFTPEGEAAVAEEQKRHLRTYFPSHEKLSLWLTLVDIEVNDQIAYKEAYGEFPKDQRAFAERQLQLRATLKGWGIAT